MRLGPAFAEPRCVTDLSTYWLIATDLDGTLLDDRYDYDNAASAIDQVTVDHNVVMLLASSKTLAEMLPLAERCTSSPLLLFENGAGIAWRSDQLSVAGEFMVENHQVITGLPLAQGYPGLRAMLEEWRSEKDYRFSGFGDYTAHEVAEITGLTLSDAVLARQRLCTEPLLWQDSPEQLASFAAQLEINGLQLISGGQFLHIMPQGGKAEAVARVAGWLKQDRGKSLGLLACGDAANDLTMLRDSDIALVFPDTSGAYLLPASATVHHARAPGPAAWLSEVNQVLNSAFTISNGNTTDE